MHNLLRHPLHADEIERALSAATPRPALPPMGDPRWDQAAAQPPVQGWLRTIRAKAETELTLPMPELTDDLYAEYHRNGYRLGFERPYFERRRRLANAAVSFLFAARSAGSDEESFRESFLEKLTDIAAETSWALPAHVKDPSGKDPRQIDLFAAETANLMAEILSVFDPSIPADLAAQIRRRVRQLHEDYLDPAHQYRWLTHTNNWNAVCHQGVLGSALVIEEDHAFVARLIARALQFLPNFVNGFSADGGCSEGPSYWEYGFGWFTVLNEQLEARSGDTLTFFEDYATVRAVALYGPQVCLSGGRLVNFADCNPRSVIRPQLFQYLGQRLRVPVLLQQARENYHRFHQQGLDLTATRRDLFFYLRFFLHCPDDLEAAHQTPAPKPDAFFDQLGVVVARGRTPAGATVEFAAKAGHNAEHHNHNDCGSFLLHAAGEPIVMEIGSPEYNRDFFNLARRYENLAARSRGHSVPLINGCEQAPGERFRSETLETRLNQDHVVFTIDLTHCYPPEAGCRSCRREFRFEKNRGSLQVIDRFELDRRDSLETALIAPSTADDGDALLLGSGPIRFRLILAPGTRLLAVETCPYSDHQGQPAEVRRIALSPETPGTTLVLGYTLEPMNNR
jgi:hypothetical protein